MNLAFEDFLFRNSPTYQTCLLLWRNPTCIVIGRNQNPFVECNVPLLRRLGIPIIRRFSGGGAVYHDLGNSLYSVHMPREVFRREAYAQMVVDSLKSIRPKLRLSPRHDIFWEDKKVSGSAYRIVRHRAYHHGTMLLDSDLSKLDELLVSPLDERMRQGGAAISSVVSPVCNIGKMNEPSPILNHELFSKLLGETFKKLHPEQVREVEITENDLVSYPEVTKVAEQLKTDSWTFDKSPPYTLCLPRADISVEDGIIVDSSDPNIFNEPITIDLLEQLLSSSTTHSNQNN